MIRMKSLNVKHKYDMSLELDQDVQSIVRATYFICEIEPKSSQKCTGGGGIDTFGCLGCAGTFGGTFGCLGTAGCCC